MMQKPCVSPRRSSRHGAALALWVAICLAGCGGPRVQPPNAAHQAATSLNQTAARALAQGETEQALALYARALAAADSVEDFELAGTTLLNLALVHARLGQLAEAQARLDRIIAAPQLYPGALQAQAAARQALLALDGPDRQRGQQAALRWADVAQAACAAPCDLAAALGNLRAHVAMERGETEAAAALADTAAQLAAAAGQEAEQANGLRLAGRAHSSAGRTGPAADLLARALLIDRRLGLPDRVALDLIAAADNEARRGQPDLSRAYLERALSVYQAAGNTTAAAALRSRIGRLLMP